MPPPPPSSEPSSGVREAELDAFLPTDLDRIRSVRRCVEGLLASEGWTEEDSADVGLVATEILQNAMEHGSRNDGREIVRLRCAMHEAGTIVMEVTDPGTGKGLAALLGRDVTTPPPIDAVRGRGLFLVHRMSQSLDRSGAADGGSMVRVRFRAALPPASR